MSNHPIVHFEISGQDHQTLASFYADTFGWRVQAGPASDHHTVDTGASQPGGFIAADSGYSGTILYIQCDDIERTVATAQANGATIVTPIERVPGDVTFAILEDPQGIRFGLIDARGPELD